MLFKGILVGLVAYYGYQRIIKPMFLPPQNQDKLSDKYQESIPKEEYLDYEEVD